jgi:hypothetical protein
MSDQPLPPPVHVEPTPESTPHHTGGEPMLPNEQLRAKLHHDLEKAKQRAEFFEQQQHKQQELHKTVRMLCNVCLVEWSLIAFKYLLRGICLKFQPSHQH